MPLRVVRRKDTGNLTISGTIRLPDGTSLRIQRRAASDKLALAQEEANAIEAETLRAGWHGERRGVKSFDEALVSYLELQPRHENTKRRLRRLREALGDVKLSGIDQDTALRLKAAMLRPGAGPATIGREIVTPLRAVLHHAQRRGWCDAPMLESPKVASGRTLFMNPEEAELLVGAAAAHVGPLLVFLLGTGARLSEAIYLDWRDVDLQGGRAIFWKTKNGNRRNAHLPPRVVVSLARLSPGTSGSVFLRPDGRPYQDRGGEYGGQIKTAWAGAIRRAGLDPNFTPHTCRHTWASWHYALHKDLLKLKQDGGWSSVALVERYAHLMPAGQEPAIRQWLGEPHQIGEMRA